MRNFKGKVTLLIIGLIFFIGFFSLNSNIIQATPASPKTPFMIGISYFSQGEYEKAIVEFEKSIQLNPTHKESYYYLGQCYLQKGIMEYNNKNIFKAYSLYRKAYEISEQVILQYEEIIKDNPEDLNSYLKLGYIYEVRSIAPFVNDYDKALGYYLKALDLKVSSGNGNNGINIYINTRVRYIYLQKKDYPQAIEYLEKAAKMSPHNAEVYYYLGLSYNKIREKEKARESFSQVIELVPQSELAHEAEKELNKLNKD